MVDRIEAVAQAARESGLRLGFHNHWSELEPLDGGATFLDLLRELDPELLWLELDLGWVWHAGGDPLAELEATSGRCPLVHVKDYRAAKAATTCLSATASSATTAWFPRRSRPARNGSSSSRTASAPSRLPQSSGRSMRLRAILATV